MGISVRRINALVKKEFKDFLKNMNVSIICILPVAYVLIFANLHGADPGYMLSKAEILNMGLVMSLILVSTFAISMLIAEEKEKNTMRTLMLSSVLPAEFLAGKAIVMLGFSTISNLAIYFITGIEMQYLIHYILWSTIVSLAMIQIGGIIGLIAQNQMATGVVGMPILMVFLIVPLLAPANEAIEKIASVLPNYNLQLLLGEIVSGRGYTAGTTYNIAVILAWIVLSAVAFGLIYNKKGLDG